MFTYMCFQSFLRWPCITCTIKIVCLFKKQCILSKLMEKKQSVKLVNEKGKERAPAQGQGQTGVPGFPVSVQHPASRRQEHHAAAADGCSQSLQQGYFLQMPNRKCLHLNSLQSGRFQLTYHMRCLLQEDGLDHKDISEEGNHRKWPFPTPGSSLSP